VRVVVGRTGVSPSGLVVAWIERGSSWQAGTLVYGYLTFFCASFPKLRLQSSSVHITHVKNQNKERILKIRFKNCGVVEFLTFTQTIVLRVLRLMFLSPTVYSQHFIVYRIIKKKKNLKF